MQESVIQTKNCSIVQDGKIVIQNVNIELNKGELVYLIGKVGSGKTSLIKTLYADLPLAAGSVKVNGFELERISHQNIPFLRRTLGIVFQDFKLLTDRTVHDNLSFVLEATGWKDKLEIDKRITEVLNDVDLTDKEPKMPNELSGGEQQRVVIARALLNKPPVILADEPTGNLDPDSSKKIMRILQLITQKGSCVLIATHQYDLIKEFPGRVFRISNNHVREIRMEDV
ncbi:MAG: ATP-binding cassette domain-containing protein [Chloroflexia bacterium]|nr:ATP-binding cassette domain-containing protein [Chloroflexia bacterium]